MFSSFRFKWFCTCGMIFSIFCTITALAKDKSVDSGFVILVPPKAKLHALFAPDEVLVKFKNNVTTTEIEKVLVKVGKGTAFRHRPDTYRVMLKNKISVEEAIKIIKKSQMVILVEPSYYARYANPEIGSKNGSVEAQQKNNAILIEKNSFSTTPSSKSVKESNY